MLLPCHPRALHPKSNRIEALPRGILLILQDLGEPISAGECPVIMRHEAWTAAAKLGLGFGIFLSVAGCYNAPKNGARIPGAATPVAQGIGHDTYVYYPAYEVYYNATRRQYVYRDGRSWVNRPDLPKAWAGNLANTPQVPVEFHDAPEKHHATVARNFPKNWHPESANSALSGTVKATP